MESTVKARELKKLVDKPLAIPKEQDAAVKRIKEMTNDAPPPMSLADRADNIARTARVIERFPEMAERVQCWNGENWAESNAFSDRGGFGFQYPILYEQYRFAPPEGGFQVGDVVVAKTWNSGKLKVTDVDDDCIQVNGSFAKMFKFWFHSRPEPKHPLYEYRKQLVEAGKAAQSWYKWGCIRLAKNADNIWLVISTNGPYLPLSGHFKALLPKGSEIDLSEPLCIYGPDKPSWLEDE